MSRARSDGGAGTALAGLTVVVARPRDQAGALVELLTERGATPLVVPLIEIVEVDDPTIFHEVIARLATFDWVVVASPNAARRIAPHLADVEVRVAAIGSTTAAALPRVDLVADRQSASGLVEIFPDGRGRVLAVQSVDGAPTLADGLRRRGWTVERVHTHAARPVVPSAGDQLAVLSADALLLSSGSQARAWVAAFGAATPPMVIAIGPQTASDATAMGLKIAAVAADHSLGGLVDAFQKLWESH